MPPPSPNQQENVGKLPEDKSLSRKSGSQRQRDGQDYERAVQFILENFISSQPHLQVDSIANLSLKQASFKNLLTGVREALNFSPWKCFCPDAIDEFSELEIDLILKVSLKDDATLNSPHTFFIPYDMEDDEICYDFDLTDGPVLIYFEITGNPGEFTKKLWQVEKMITLHNLLQDNKNSEELLENDKLANPESKNVGKKARKKEEVQTEIDDKVKKWNEWILSHNRSYFAILSDQDRDVWRDNFVSKLCIFHELSFLTQTPFKFEADLAKDLVKMLVKNNVEEMVKVYKDKNQLKSNSIQHTNIGKALKESRMLFIFVDASLDIIWKEMKASQKERGDLRKENSKLKESVSKLLEELENIKKQKGINNPEDNIDSQKSTQENILDQPQG